VRLCKDRTTDKLFAIKIFSKDFLKKKKTGKSDETFFEDIKREIAIMKKLLHPNVLRLFEVLDDPKVPLTFLSSHSMHSIANSSDHAFLSASR
jgi:[calcium/calmodulin-dependent protein kinase] kinase